MNDKLKEIADAAYSFATNITREDTPEFAGFYDEKFAELLITDALKGLLITESAAKEVHEKYGIKYVHRMTKNPKYGDLIPLDEFFDDVETLTTQMFTPDAGNGLWATSTHYANVSVWEPKPDWATHVLWYNQ